MTTKTKLLKELEKRILDAVESESAERFALDDEKSELFGIHKALNMLFDKIAETSKLNRKAIEKMEEADRIVKKKQDDLADFTKQLVDEFESSVNTKTDQFDVEIQTVAGISKELSVKSGEMIEQIRSSKEKSEEMSFRVQSVATATEELSASISEISKQTGTASIKSKDSMETLRKTTETVENITVAAESVAEIIDIINDVARQTNLLALNAAIEAARAGEVGRGFGVVAGEVKELARQTRTATQNISQKINNMLSATESGKTSIQEVSHSIQEVTEMVNVIATAIDEQSSVTQSIAKNAGEASQTTQVLDSNFERMSGYSTEVDKQLVDMVTQVTTLTEETSILRATSQEFVSKLNSGQL